MPAFTLKAMLLIITFSSVPVRFLNYRVLTWTLENVIIDSTAFKVKAGIQTNVVAIHTVMTEIYLVNVHTHMLLISPPQDHTQKWRAR